MVLIRLTLLFVTPHCYNLRIYNMKYISYFEHNTNNTFYHNLFSYNYNLCKPITFKLLVRLIFGVYYGHGFSKVSTYTLHYKTVLLPNIRSKV
jgi:hypothetical protein